MKSSLLALLPTFLGVTPVAAVPGLVPRQSSGTAVVSLSNNTGPTNHLASGIIFGIPQNASQIPDHMYTDWGFNFARGGGPQLPSPAGGWLAGRTQYENRMKEVMGNYQAAKKYGAKFICLYETLYGEWDVNNGPYPGDNGNWADWDRFTQAVIADMKSYGVSLDDFIIEIFNEVDGPWYWTRPQSQALEMWRRSYNAFRKAFGTDITIQGPSTSGEPQLSNNWWTTFAQYIKTNDCIPDTWTWHMEAGGSQNIGGAWWISQLERVDAPGLRGNWQGYPGLYDYLANLVSKPNAPNAPADATGYFPNGEYQVYKYYAQSMTGHRVGTMPSLDMTVDVYATVDTQARVVKLLAGSRQKEGTWTIEVKTLNALGLPSHGTLSIKCLAFPSAGWWGKVEAPSSCGVYPSTSYSNDKLDIVLYQKDTGTAYAWEFSY
ncbi:hypothetical protein H9Q70_001763 [Fusarium xylarioides]|nr:hypothetical protein H9Q70_001763 [Fusarium xylarioides]KAG5783836.1 hypothetical protein H9Q73_002484 [Fusarium xylarioides]